MWSYRPSTEPQILISPPVEPVSSPGEGEIHRHVTLMHENTERQPQFKEEHHKCNTWIFKCFYAVTTATIAVKRSLQGQTSACIT